MPNEALEKAKNKSAVYYDGSCPVCTLIIEKIDDSSKGEKFSMLDITKEPLPRNFTKENVEKEIHVIADGKTFKNAEAILKILEVYPAWKFFVWLGRLPLIRNVLPVGYNFVAANRHFLFGSPSRIYWIKVVAALGLISSLLLSLKLWAGSRLYSFTPVLDIFPPIKTPFDWIILLGLFSCLISIILSSKPKPFLFATVGIVTTLVLLDQQRLQPWVFQYVFMLVALGLFSWKWRDAEGRNAVLNICRLIVASIYFWSGVQKVNVEFVINVFPWMSSPITNVFPESTLPAFYIFGILVPFIEIAIGIGLLTRKFRNVSIWLAVAMCTFVLSTIGPLGHNWNSTVWPWNIAIVTLAILLFAKTPSVSYQQIIWVKNSLFHKFVLFVFGFLPLLYFFNAWDSYLSWSLYSGTVNTAEIYVDEKAKDQLPEYIQSLITTDGTGKSVLLISDWSFAELNVPPYPETRIFRNIGKSICEFAEEDSSGVEILIHGRLSWFYRDEPQKLSCSELE